jgi:transcriptional antiterminator RfaH
MARGGLEVVEILFPCYLFVQSDGGPDWVLRARSAPNVMRLLGGSAGPEPVPDRLVRALRSRGLEQIVPNRFLPGQRVRISDGAFRDIEGIFECEYPGERARIFIQLLRRLVPVIVDVADLRDPS